MPDWFVLRVASSRELAIERRIQALGLVAMVPYGVGSRRVRGNVRKGYRFPLFTSYVFTLLADAGTGLQLIQRACNTIDQRVVYQLLGGNSPIPLSAADAAYLSSIADGKYKHGDTVETIKVGDEVLVPDGLILQGERSTVVSIKAGKKAKIKITGEKNDIFMQVPLAELKKV